MYALGLGGLIHLWGDAGSGKTLFAVALACDVSKNHRVEWINTDAKKSFVSHLKKNAVASGGKMENITVTFTEDQAELCTLIEGLPSAIAGVSLVIIDPITRVLDLARDNPILWGREIIEDVLPTLTGIVSQNNIDFIITSESRMMPDSTNRAVHHNSISRWADHDLCITRNTGSPHSQVSRFSENGMKELASMRMDSRGVIEVIPQMVLPTASGGVNELVW
ncbi:MAG: hypothetical protein C4K48_09985 [Candidatus Thorarchaeota archaeon]|nr:MAG: hypothetical protein C4K48_09985 [Candidatus Thorarchaeota archaeon]